MERFNPFSLEGKTVLVTGASSGIGRAVAVACSKMGASVVVNGRDLERIAETMDALAKGQTHKAAPADLLNAGETAAMVAELPALDGIVHCAGVLRTALCKYLSEGDFDVVMDSNFKAPAMLQTEIIRRKKLAANASIVFVASVASSIPYAGNSVYSASKGAMISYANCLAVELAKRGVRVNCISPAMVRTNLIYTNGLTEEELQKDEMKYPLKRYGTPDDVANLAIYLLSDASSWMSGSNIKISGGI